MKVHTLPDITCDGNPNPVSAESQLCRWFQVTAVSIASTPARVGDEHTTTARGVPVSVGNPFIAWPSDASETELFDLKDVFTAGASNDKLSVVFAI